MTTSNNYENGLAPLMMRHMTGANGFSPSVADHGVAEVSPRANGSGWIVGYTESYDREYAVYVELLFAFLQATQPDEYAKLRIGDSKDNTAIAQTEREIALIQENRTRRTGDVVSGKLDVRPAAELPHITMEAALPAPAEPLVELHPKEA